MRPTRQFWAVFWMLAVVLAGLIAWFLGNLLYSLFWKQLGDWGFPITEAQTIAYICAHLVPFALALLITAILAVLSWSIWTSWVWRRSSLGDPAGAVAPPTPARRMHPLAFRLARWRV